MPIYEYYCESCDGVFEALRPMREASYPWPCPQCSREAQRIMPTSFNAFTFRDGYPRRIPDRGTYWHLGQEVKTLNTGGVPANEHPELYKPPRPPRKAKGELKAEAERQALAEKEEEHKKKEEYRSPPPGLKGQRKYDLELVGDWKQQQKREETKKSV